MAAAKHRYVNLNLCKSTITRDPTEGSGVLVVLPWHERHRRKGDDCIFVVEGAYYAQFVGPKGPLYPFPKDAEGAEGGAPTKPVRRRLTDAEHQAAVRSAATRSAVAAEQARREGADPADAAAQAVGGRFQGSGEVVRGGETVHDTGAADAPPSSISPEAVREILKAPILEAMEEQGINDFESFLALSDEEALSIPFITESNLTQIRAAAQARIDEAQSDDAVAEPDPASKPATRKKTASKRTAKKKTTRKKTASKKASTKKKR